MLAGQSGAGRKRYSPIARISMPTVKSVIKRVEREVTDRMMQGAQLPQPTRSGEVLWIEPYPDALLDALDDQAPGPEARYDAREQCLSPLLRRSSFCHHTSGQSTSCATYSGFTQKRSHGCSTPPKRQ